MFGFLKDRRKQAQKRPTFQPSVEQFVELVLPSGGFNYCSYLAPPPPAPIAHFALPPAQLGVSCGPFDWNTSNHFTISTPIPAVSGVGSHLTVDNKGSLNGSLNVPLPGPVPWGVKASGSYNANGSAQVWAGAFAGLPNCNAYFQFQIYARR